MSESLSPPIPVDEHHGLGGSYVIEDGVRRLVHRTRALGEAGMTIAPTAPQAPEAPFSNQPQE